MHHGLPLPQETAGDDLRYHQVMISRGQTLDHLAFQNRQGLGKHGAAGAAPIDFKTLMATGRTISPRFCSAAIPATRRTRLPLTSSGAWHCATQTS